MLALEVADLVALGIDVTLTGFDPADLDRILGREHGAPTVTRPPPPSCRP